LQELDEIYSNNLKDIPFHDLERITDDNIKVK
jgi:hypothetical protein